MMETAVQPRTSKITIKFRNIPSSSTADNSDNKEGGNGASNSRDIPGSLANPSQERAEESHSTVDEGNLQLVLYEPPVDAADSTQNAPDPVGFMPPVLRPHPFSDHTPRVLPAIGAFTVQCANCFKWRLIPTKEKYEEIREHIMERPFLCETAREWKPEISCEDPPDITQDGSRLWAIDKPSIAQAPPGWERLLRIRAEGGSKFADVYYVAPTGKRLRSMVEVQKFLDEHPEYTNQGITLTQFSFQIPRPMQENYVRKRPARAAPSNDAGDIGMSASQAQPLSWVGPDLHTPLQLRGSGNSTDYGHDADPENREAKRRRTP